ncbi:MAG: carbon storage regulator [Acidobacteriota bacterium]
MLVIRRRVGEILLIGDDVEVEILESSGSQVKLGIRAPRAINVLRKEILTVRDQNRAAAQILTAVGGDTPPLEGTDLELLAKKFKPLSPAPIRAV